MEPTARFAARLTAIGYCLLGSQSDVWFHEANRRQPRMPPCMAFRGGSGFNSSRPRHGVALTRLVCTLVGATGFEPSQHRPLVAALPTRVTSAWESFCVRRSVCRAKACLF